MKLRRPKDMTRITSLLLRFGQERGGAMLTPKTHFEQVPTEVVKKLVADQIKREALAKLKAEQKSSTKTLDEHETK